MRTKKIICIGHAVRCYW